MMLKEALCISGRDPTELQERTERATHEQKEFEKERLRENELNLPSRRGSVTALSKRLAPLSSADTGQGEREQQGELSRQE